MEDLRFHLNLLSAFLTVKSSVLYMLSKLFILVVLIVEIDYLFYLLKFYRLNLNFLSFF